MKCTISKQYQFDAAHALTNLPYDSPCKRLHGHTYTVTVYVTGEIDLSKIKTPTSEDQFMLIDYNILDKIIKPYIDNMDHALLVNLDMNTSSLVEFYKNQDELKYKIVTLDYPPTAEMIAYILATTMAEKIRILKLKLRDHITLNSIKVKVQETPKTAAEVEQRI